MLILLSSGARARYRDDIVRCLALPPGGLLQFRYDTEIVEPDVITQAKATRLRGQLAIVAYASTYRVGAAVEIVLCRFVKIVEAVLVGSSLILRFEVQNYIGNHERARIRDVIGQNSQSKLPHWAKDNGADVLRGLFVFSAEGDFTTQAADATESFESTVDDLCKYQDFSREKGRTFFSVAGVHEISETTNANVSALNLSTLGVYQLGVGKTYEVRVYVYAPDDGTGAKIPETELHISAETDSVEFMTPKIARIDSEYDLKRFRFTVPSRIFDVATSFAVFIGEGDKAGKGACDILLPMKFKGDWKKGVLQTGLVTIGASVPAMIAAHAAGKLDFSLAAIMFLAALATGLGTVYFQTQKK